MRRRKAYDAWTEVQSEVARALVARAAIDRTHSAPRTILDIGAGTGHVTGLAKKNGRARKIAALDAAPKMLARLKAKFSDVETIRADAASFASAARYDLILSSMALHWLDDPARVLENWRGLLAPDGALHVATPVEGTLGEWRVFLREAGLQDLLWRFPAENFACDCEIVAFPARFDSATAFARSLKKSGAIAPPPAVAPCPPRRCERRWRSGPGCVHRDVPRGVSQDDPS